jgi:chorismate dehydratase
VAKTKISIVQYLNSVPLAWGILEGRQADRFDATLSTPAQCADQLAAGTVDIGLIPSIEYQRIKGTKIVPGCAVASRQRVKSVLLLSERPLPQVRTVAHDNGSRTSVALAQIVFNEFCHTRPTFEPADPDPKAMLASHDAAVIIGDKALKFMEENEIPEIDKEKPLVREGAEPLYIFDLMERWEVLTGLPFVFAFWAVREGFDDKSVIEALNESRDFGVANIPTIAERYSGPLSMKKDFLQAYLEHNVDYYLDEKCGEGLELFYRKASHAHAIHSVRNIEYL